MDIGTKIKQLRLANDLTLEELASRSELTKGFLSQVERNLTSPSISSLEDILEALGTNLASFLKKKERSRSFLARRIFCLRARRVYDRVDRAERSKNEMEPILLTLEGNGISQTIDPHRGQEFGYVLKGEICLVMGKETYRLKAKETFYLNAAPSHYLKNPTRKEAKVLWITMPPMF